MLLDARMRSTSVLDVRDLTVSVCGGGRWLPVVSNVSFTIDPGQTVAIVGESGCGKSTLALSLLGLLPRSSWRIGGRAVLDAPPHVKSVDLLAQNERSLRRLCGRSIAMIFQDPVAALNPVMPIGVQLIEALRLHRPMTRRRAVIESGRLLQQVGFAQPDTCLRSYAHELSGGMAQRVMIAMAVACEPAVLIADEPASALDAASSTQMLDLLSRLQQRLDMAMVLISHDIRMVARHADVICVMYAGRIVEQAPAGRLMAHPLHPYTRALMDCVVTFDGQKHRLPVIGGVVPSPHDVPTGCAFHPRCKLTTELARLADDTQCTRVGQSGAVVLRSCTLPSDTDGQPAVSLTQVQPGHWVACPQWDRSADVQLSDRSMHAEPI